MPQFDFTTYSAQIFWFTICFLALYFFMANVILPRIRNIIADRKNVISDDTLAAQSLAEKSDSTRSKTDDILLAGSLKYKTAMDEATKEAAKRKEKSLEEFKITAEKLIEKSKAEIEKTIQDSASKNREYIERLATLTQNKIFNS